MPASLRQRGLFPGQRINSIGDTKSFLRYAIAGWTEWYGIFLFYTIKESARLVGSFGVINDNGKLQFGYILSPSQWGNGYATEVCKNHDELAETPRRSVYRIQSFVDVENIASAKVLMKSGLIEEATIAEVVQVC